ncbi:Hint domain-containing protein [Amylibacter sp. SFDW26]|uniref:Hint domain-containing protein n=1 Tax=Amylibacter sp. SFDW26 TaxID=2652722 RepID=UPI00126211A9|nr:Hint domain-containing protein [Amylibacter sp. SFDW26]KAB7615909.1 Hint domain-containing protein [Amylibacter sp. SFDW26]
MALENVLVYNFASGDNTYPHSGNFTISVGGQVSIDDSNGSDDAIFGDFTHTGGFDVADQDVTASTVPGINVGDTIDLRYKYTFTGSDGSSGTIYFIATNGTANYGPNIVSDTPLDPSVTYTFGTFNTDGAVPYSSLVPCFTKGTFIQTDLGQVAIEDLCEGDRVVTLDRGAQTIRWIGSTIVPACQNLAPVYFKAGAIGNTRDLYVSQNHRMMITNTHTHLLFGEQSVLVAAKHLVNNDDICIKRGGDVEYFHILFDRHEIVFAENVPSESFQLGAQSFDSVSDESRKELLRLFPDLKKNTECYSSSARQSLKAHEAALLNAAQRSVH